MKILVADDNQLIQSVLSSMLAGHDVSFVTTGRELHNLMTGCRDLYQLLIVDIWMPGCSGPDAVALGNALGADIPVIYMTGSISPLPRVLQKPFSKEQLLEIIDDTIKDYDGKI